jgi:hypothetical protein
MFFQYIYIYIFFFAKLFFQYISVTFNHAFHALAKEAMLRCNSGIWGGGLSTFLLPVVHNDKI